MLLNVVIMLLVVGVGLYMLQFAPIDATIKKIIKGVTILVVLIFILRLLWPMMGGSL